MIVINWRQNNILQEVLNNKTKSLYEYSQIYNVSERTIRNDIKTINDNIENHPILIINEEGVVCFESVNCVDEDYINTLFSKKDFYSYKLSPNERKTVLALMLLKADKFLTVAILSENVFMSRNTVLNDLDELREWFKDNGMGLVSSTRRGFAVEGSERNIRDGVLKLLLINSNLMLNNKEDSGNIFHKILVKELDTEDEIEIIEEIVREVERKNDVRLAEFSFRELIYYCLVMVIRLRQGRVISHIETIDWNSLTKSSKYNLAVELFQNLAKQFGFGNALEEIPELINALRRKSYIKNNGKSIDMLEIQVLVNEFIYKISTALHINYYLDFYFYDLLVAHIRAAVYRIRQGYLIENPILTQLKDMYPYVFNEVRTNITSLEVYLKHRFTDDEISFISMYIVSVMEKAKSDQIKVKVLIVCNSGQGTAQLVVSRVQANIKLVEIVDITSSHRLGEIDHEFNVDMIVSTVTLKNSKFPYIKVNPLLTQEDINNIQKMAMDIQDKKQALYFNQKSKEILPIEKIEDTAKNSQTIESLLKSKHQFSDIITLDSIQLDVTVSDWRDAVKKAGLILLKKELIRERYIQAMISNIEGNGPYVVIYPGIAVPHAMETDGALKVGASLIRLNEPIFFNHETNDPVRFIVALSVIDTSSIDRPLYNLTKMMATGTFIDDLTLANSNEQIMDIIAAYEKNC